MANQVLDQIIINLPAPVKFDLAQVEVETEQDETMRITLNFLLGDKRIGHAFLQPFNWVEGAMDFTTGDEPIEGYYIRELYVEPEYRHQGLGRKAMEFIISTTGLDFDITLDAGPVKRDPLSFMCKVDRLIAFYEFYGFEQYDPDYNESLARYRVLSFS